MEARDRFLNFPIVLLQGFLEDHKRCLANIFHYSVFEMVYSDKARFESIDEFIEEFEFEIPKRFIPHIVNQGRELYDSCYGMNYPWTGIHIDTYLRFTESRNQFDLVCLLLFLALKSIIQKKPFCNAKNPIILARMAGFPKSDAIIPENITFWMNSEKRRRKVFSELEKHYKLVRAFRAQGINFSINKLSQVELELALMKQKDEKSDRQESKKKQDAKNEAKRKFEEWKKRKENDKGEDPNETGPDESGT